MDNREVIKLLEVILIYNACIMNLSKGNYSIFNV